MGPRVMAAPFRLQMHDGWKSAWPILEKCQDPEKQARLVDLCCISGVRGPGLKYLAGLLRFKTRDLREKPDKPRGLSGFEAAFVERRAEELLRT